MLFCCIIVIYNKSYKNSATMNFILNSEMYKNNQVEVYLVDNSTKDFENREVKNINHITYISMHGNVGIPKAYNCALDIINKSYVLDDVVVVLMDDDSLFPEDYFQVLMNAMDDEYDVYISIARDGNQLISPFKIENGLGVMVNDISEVNESNMSGINSGMAIKGYVFNDYRYDEDLFLDYVDNEFIRYVRRKDLKTKLINATIKQNLSISTDNYDATINRFKIFKKDIKTYFKKDEHSSFYGSYLILYRKYQIFKKFKKPQIFFM